MPFPIPSAVEECRRARTDLQVEPNGSGAYRRVRRGFPRQFAATNCIALSGLVRSCGRSAPTRTERFHSDTARRSKRLRRRSIGRSIASPEDRSATTAPSARRCRTDTVEHVLVARVRRPPRRYAAARLRRPLLQCGWARSARRARWAQTAVEGGRRLALPRRASGVSTSPEGSGSATSEVARAVECAASTATPRRPTTWNPHIARFGRLSRRRRIGAELHRSEPPHSARRTISTR